MNVLVLLLVVGAFVALGVGSLTNNVGLNVQELGVGEQTINSPIDAAGLILLIERTNPDSLIDFKDLIVSCKFNLADGEPDIVEGSTIYCKLIDEDGNLIAEGQVTLGQGEGLVAPAMIEIPIDWFAFPNSNNIDEIGDVIFVVQGPPQS